MLCGKRNYKNTLISVRTFRGKITQKNDRTLIYKILAVSFLTIFSDDSSHNPPAQTDPNRSSRNNMLCHDLLSSFLRQNQ